MKKTCARAAFRSLLRTAASAVPGLFLAFTLCISSGLASREQGLRAGEKVDYRSRKLVLPMNPLVRSLDPKISVDYPSAYVIRMLFEGLMRYGPKGEIEPGIASHYEVSEDRKHYVFHLRDAKWSNGDPLTAHDFEYAWKRSISPESARFSAYVFSVIHNARRCFKGEVDIDQVGVKAIDDRTLSVDLEYPVPYFLSLTCSTAYVPVNKKSDEADPNWGNHMEKVVSNGPFLLKDCEWNNYMSLERSPLYWDVENVQLPGLELYAIGDEMTALHMFEKGEIDWIGNGFSGVPHDLLTSGKWDSDLRVEDGAAIAWIMCNTEFLPLGNKNFRKALSLALDRNGICQAFPYRRPTDRVLNSVLRVRDPSPIGDVDLQEANLYLDKALDELNLTRDTLPKITIAAMSNASAPHLLIQLATDQWRKGLGIDIACQEYEWVSFLRNTLSGNFQLSLMGWVSWIYDPIYTLEAFKERGNSLNGTKWEHPLYRAYIDDSYRELDADKRRDLLRKAEDLLLEEAPVIPISTKPGFRLQHPHLHGVYVSALSELDFKYAYFSSEDE